MQSLSHPILGLALGLTLVASSALATSGSGSISEQPFGKTNDGKKVQLYTLRNQNGVEAKITNYGGIIVSLTAPDRNGKFDDVVLGYSTLKEYIKSNPYFGALIGRYGNRIAKGKFELEGKPYKLAVNNGVNALHGGIKGFDKVVWTAKSMETKAGPALQLNYVSKDGEEGYPGTLSITALYTLTQKNEIKLEFSATTDKTTIINLTQHSYFNLAGAGSGDVLGHVVSIYADRSQIRA